MIGTWLPNLTNRITFVIVDATYTEVAGLDGGYTLEVSKNGGAMVGSAGVKTEISDGWYSYVATAGEADTDGPVSIKVTGAGAIQQNLVYEVRDWSSIILSAAGLAAIWTYVTRTLTAGGVAAIAAAVWTYATRTLTMSLTSLKNVIRGFNIEIFRGDTFDLNIVRLGDISTRTDIWFTVKADKDEADTASTIQISETVGLEYIAGGAAAVPGNGSITVTDAGAGNITIFLEAVETAKLPLIGNFYYDLQWVDAAGVVITIRVGRAPIVGDITRVVT